MTLAIILLASLPNDPTQAVQSLSIADIHRNFRAKTGATFGLTGQISAGTSSKFVLTDATGSEWITPREGLSWKIGDEVLTVCHASDLGPDLAFIRAERIDVQAHRPPPEPLALSLDEIDRGKADFKSVRTHGVITRALIDEIDTRWTVLYLESMGRRAFVTYANGGEAPPQHLVDRAVELTGVCIPYEASRRQYNNRKIHISSPADIRPIDSAAAAGVLPLDLPGLVYDPPPEFPHRCRLNGRVIACHGKDFFFLRTADDHRVRVRIAPGERLPECDTVICATGFAHPLRFFPRLDNALVRPCAEDIPATETIQLVSAKSLFFDALGKRRIDPKHDGKVIRLEGLVRNHSSDNGARILLESDGILLPVLTTGPDFPPISSRIEVTGVCLTTPDPEELAVGIVRLDSLSVIVRSPSDIRILEVPSWWTSARLLTVIAVLAVGLAMAGAWSMSLRRLANRRRRQLDEEQADRAGADLRAEERTRLAVELHDSVAQDLTGISLQLDAVNRFANDPIRMRRHLDLANRTLHATRNELKNCLWDLRNRALEAADMNEAIGLTVRPFIGETQLVLRFNVPRSSISDNTVHGLLRIIRELASNAVRHGHARHVRIAGALDGKTIRCSVRDDGCGFDTKKRPGVGEGHFGLEGVAERVNRLGGTLTLNSAPGRGTDIIFTLSA